MSRDANAIAERFRKIMGPVASTLAAEAARESGGRTEGERIVIDDEKKLEKFRHLMKKKCGKIIGERLAENILREG